MSKVIELDRKLKSIKSIHNMAEAMQVVAVAQLRSIQSRQTAAKHFKKHYDRLAQRLDISVKRQAAKVKPNILVYVISSQRGFCGGFNDRLIADLRRTIDEKKQHGKEVQSIVVGGKGCEIFRLEKIPGNLRCLIKSEKMGFDQVSRLMAEAFDLYYRGEVEEVYILFNEFKTMLEQTPKFLKLLPYDLPKSEGSDDMIIIEPSIEAVKKYVCQRYLQVAFYDAFLQSQLGEVASRLMTMRGATDNSKEMIGEIKIKINKARQAMITFELSEIISSFEVLKEEEH